MRISGKTWWMAGLLWASLHLDLRADNLFRMEEGAPAMQSAGPLAFGPQNVLFVGDTKGAAVFAIDTGANDMQRTLDTNIDDLGAALAELLDVPAGSVRVNDLAIPPRSSGNIYLSLSVGDDQKPALVKIDGTGQLSRLNLDRVLFSKADLPDAPDDQITGSGGRQRNLRDESITDLAFVDGRVLVSGMVKGDTPSAVRSIPFPFSDENLVAGIEIYHAAHGRSENNATIRTFVPFVMDGKPSLLAGFTCTPLVRFNLDGIQSNSQVKGTTVAELGNRNRPLDMIVYRTGGGEPYLLMSNSARGMMKISTKDIEREQGLTEPVTGGGTAGQSFETVADLEDVVQMDMFRSCAGADRLVVLLQKEGGPLQLKTVDLP